jgi:hypothetical protein
LTVVLHLEYHLDAVCAETVPFSAESTVSGRTRAERPLANTLVWDTLSPFLNKIDVRDRTDWKVVPTEFDRWKGPRYYGPEDYGREYYFKGDVVLENEYLIAVFSSKRGKVIIYSKADYGKKRIEFIPLKLKGKPVNITSCRILQNTGDEAALKVSFSDKEMEKNLSAIFSFSDDQIIGVKPAENMKGISLFSPIEFAVVPSFIGDDLIFDPREYPSVNTLYIPSENLFLGLLKGENNMLVITRPKGNQKMRLILDNKEEEGRLIESVDFENDGESIYLAILDAPGIWHKEELKPSYLEKDVAISWKKPFPVKWITQLYEDGVKTTFTFRESKPKRFWRGGVGSYTYPVWFKGENAFYHLGKKIPPKGESLIYFLERNDTPASVSTPVDIMKETLGRQTCDTILDLAGRKLRSHRRRNAVIGAATCEVTNEMQPVFEEAKEVEKKEYIEGGVDDMVYFITRQRERINEYQDFAHDMMSFLNLKSKSNPDLKPFLDGMETITKEILREYSRQRQNIKTLEYANELARKTKALTQKKDPKNLPTFSDLKMKWRGMGGAQDYLVCKFHTITRKLFQEAGYSCVNQPQAVKIAEEIRRSCKKCLRNPDSYEIWPNY